MSIDSTTFTKVFVGNLSFKTKANELAAEFSAAGKVVSTNIITRGTRSLGFGFVEMENDEAAHKSVALLNKKSIDGREINVEVARPRDEAKIARERAEREKVRAEGGERPRRFRGPRAPRTEGEEVTQRAHRAPRNEGEEGTRAPRAPRVYAPRAPRNEGDVTSAPRTQRAPRAPRNEGEEVTQRAPRAPRAPRTEVEGSTTPVDAADKPRRKRSARRRAPRKEGEDTPARDPATQAPRTRKPRGPRAPRNDIPKIPSTTTLFVANLPFAVTNEEFAALFKETSPVKAHVVLNKNNRSKGFGFVEYADEAAQTAALEKLNATELVSVGRTLAVKIAYNPPVIETPTASAETSAVSDETPTA